MNVVAFSIATLVAYFVWAFLCLRSLAISVRSCIAGTVAGILTYLILREH